MSSKLKPFRLPMDILGRIAPSPEGKCPLYVKIYSISNANLRPLLVVGGVWNHRRLSRRLEPPSYPSPFYAPLLRYNFAGSFRLFSSHINCRGNIALCAITPPSTGIMEPFMNEFVGRTKLTVAWATSIA